MLVEIESDGVGEHRFGGPEVHFQSRGYLKPLDGKLSLIGSRCDIMIISGSGARGTAGSVLSAGRQHGREELARDENGKEPRSANRQQHDAAGYNAIRRKKSR